MAAESIKKEKYLTKTLEAIKLVDNGADPATALQITNNKANISRYAVDKFKVKYRKYSLTHPKMIKAANNQVTRILSGEVRLVDQQKVTKNGEIVNYTETIAPSDTNILAAASMVYDRVEPVQRGADVVNNSLTINAIPAAAQEIIDKMMRWKTTDSSSVANATLELDSQVVSIVK